MVWRGGERGRAEARLSRFGGALVLACCALLLWGCVPTRAAPSGPPTQADYDQFVQRAMDQYWRDTGLPDRLRPPDPTVEYLGTDDWTVVLSSCMVEKGFSDYADTGNGLVIGDFTADQEENIAWYLCQSTHQWNPADYSLLSSEQLEYLYDYNRSTLVPCLEAHGYDVEFAPTREEAGTYSGPYAAWSPYYSLGLTFDPTTDAADRRLLDTCAPFPVGEAFDPYRDMW